MASLFPWRGKTRAMPGHGVLWLVQALACAAVAWVAAQGLWWFMGPGSPPLAPKPLPALAEQAHRAAARNFFEAQEAPEPSTTSAHSGPPPGTLDPRWKLLGTYVDAAGHSRALMSLDGTTDVVVAHVGDHLPSGHAVAEVRNESVVLDKAGQRAELTLRAAAGGPPGSMGSTGPAGPAGPSGPTGPTAPAAPAGAGPGSGTPPAFVDAQPLPPGARVAPSASPAPFTKDSR